ncbi:MAG: hypothetical protein M3Z08_10125 [Chloroflexota bacterium]|nr:hypothetical protein [Chloroflexota bacterium]
MEGGQESPQFDKTTSAEQTTPVQQPLHSAPANGADAGAPAAATATETTLAEQPDDTVSSGEPTLPLKPAWPPAHETFQRRETLSTGSVILLSILAALLIAGSLGLFFYLTIAQYSAVLHTQYAATARAHTTAQAQLQATANIVATTQTHINATATAQSNSTVSATAQANLVTATASTLNNTLTQVTGGTPAFNDSLSDNTGNNHWDEGMPVVGTGCAFTGGNYHASAGRQGYLQPCIARSTSFSNFVYQVQLTIDKGDQGGILFRGDGSQGAYYIFRIGTNGSYALDIYTGSAQGTTLNSGFNAAISIGPNQSNTLAVIAQNNTIDLYANQQYIAAISDSTLSSGQIGVVALDYTLPTEVEFSNAQVWKL